MSVGDVTSNARGSGARYNDGKLQMDLIPACYWLECLKTHCDGSDLMDQDLLISLEALTAFQGGDDDAIGDTLSQMPPDLMSEATRVFEYGAKKYAAWNWAKGMAWSIPTGCILRHALAMADGESVDPESGCAHIGHIVCNLIMLDWFRFNYPEGDDRPPVLQVDDEDYEESAEEIIDRIIAAAGLHK